MIRASSRLEGNHLRVNPKEIEDDIHRVHPVPEAASPTLDFQVTLVTSGHRNLED